MKKYFIYGHRNKINGKWYIGQTSKKKPESRYGLNGSNYLRSKNKKTFDQEKFANAILKYGWENFEHIILEENVNEADVDSKERFWIEQKDSIKNGYNSSIGGQKNHGLSNEIRKQFSETRKGAGNPMYGKKLSDETKQYLSRIRSGRNSPMFGTHLSEETKRKISESKKNLSLETRKNISNAKIGNTFRRKAVLQLDLDGNFIKEFPSALAASKEFNAFNGSNIVACCNNKKKKAYGFKWKYKE